MGICQYARSSGSDSTQPPRLCFLLFNCGEFVQSEALLGTYKFNVVTRHVIPGYPSLLCWQLAHREKLIFCYCCVVLLWVSKYWFVKLSAHGAVSRPAISLTVQLCLVIYIKLFKVMLFYIRDAGGYLIASANSVFYSSCMTSATCIFLYNYCASNAVKSTVRLLENCRCFTLSLRY